MPLDSASPRLILASASPRRRELLSALGIAFEVVPSDVDEEIGDEGGSAECWAAILAERKALHIVRQPSMADAVVLAADTIVVAPVQDRQRILGKPADADDARRMLRLLSGRTHVVYTGIALTVTSARSEGSAVEVVATQVRFRELTDAEIDAYLATGEPFDKAGAYGIQSHASAFVEHIRGDYYNVVGLPAARVRELLSIVYPHVGPAPALPDTPFPILAE